MSLGSLIRKKRRRLDPEKTQEDICKEISKKYPLYNISQKMLSSIERGAALPSCISLVAICDAIGIEPTEVWEALREELRSRKDAAH
ncbi:MAG: helix-turn-helix transcriptional regulator [Cyanobacteria bacterium P01_H01_bin.74]